MDFKILPTTPLYETFSELGKRIFLPDGIFYWSGRAKKEAEIMGTIGSAFGFEKDFMEAGGTEWLPCYLKEVKEYTSLGVKDVVPYASIGGLAETRQVWKDWILEKSPFPSDVEKKKREWLKKYISLPLITSGVTNGIFLSSQLFLNPGEVLISPNKRWGNYDNIITKFSGAQIKSFAFFEGQQMNLRGLEEAITEVAKSQKKIVIILNFPNNPTGYVPSQEEAEALISLLKTKQKELNIPFIIIVDDAYEPYIYSKEVLNESFFYALQQLEQDIIPVKLDGITKELLLYGARIGFITIGLKPSWVASDAELETLKAELNNKLEGMNRSTISNCNHFYQAMLHDLFTKKGTNQLKKTREAVISLLKARYEKINEELKKIQLPEISVDPNSGGFFLFLNIDPEKVKATDFADHLLRTYKVGVIPIEKPAEKINGIRIAYCSIDLEKIPDFVSRIKQALNDF